MIAGTVTDITITPSADTTPPTVDQQEFIVDGVSLTLPSALPCPNADPNCVLYDFGRVRDDHYDITTGGIAKDNISLGSINVLLIDRITALATVILQAPDPFSCRTSPCPALGGTEYPFTVDLGRLEVGSYEVQEKITDAAGNTFTVLEQFTIEDTTPPTVISTQPLNNAVGVELGAIISASFSDFCH